MKDAYTFPHEVIEDPALGIEQKRALLSEWASDACAVEDFPTLRKLPGTSFPVTLSAIMDARARLDRSSPFEGENSQSSDLAFGPVIAFARRGRSEHRA